MKRKLFSNTKWLTTTFAIAITVITVVLLVLRLTFLKDMASALISKVETIEGNYLNYTYNQEIYFPSLTGEGNVLIQSSKENTSYMTVVITYEGLEKPLLDTGYIRPGESRAKLPLDNGKTLKLADGVYACVATIKAYDMETQDLLGSEEQDVTLFIGVKPGEAGEEDFVPNVDEEEDEDGRFSGGEDENSNESLDTGGQSDESREAEEQDPG